MYIFLCLLKVSTRWKDAAYKKSVWKGLEARLHLNRSNPTLFPSLVRRGIKDVQVLSLRKSPRELVNGIPNIESLNLSGCYNLSDPNLEWAFIKEVSSLTKLNLSLCKEVTDNSLGRIATNCKNLQDLDLAGCCKITNAGIFSLSWGLKKLKRLNLRSCRQISDQGIGHLTGTTAADLQAAGLGGSPTLEELSLQDCQKLTDESLRYVSEGLPNLRSLNLSFCVSITDTGLKSLAKMTSLEAVNLRSCDNVSDIGLGFLAAAEQQQEQNNQRKLVKLDVSFCGNVTDASLRHIASGLAGLQNLSMTTCAITDEGLVRLAASAGLANSLKELNIGQCVSVSDEGLEAVGKTMKQLQIIDLYGCPNVTEAGISSIKAHLPKLTKLNLSL
jgi:F-box/leucine-rich repeat protein 14